MLADDDGSDDDGLRLSRSTADRLHGSAGFRGG